MDRLIRMWVLEKLSQIRSQLTSLSKEISTTPVAGLELVREDLEGKKAKAITHGQKHKQPVIQNKITVSPSSASVPTKPTCGSL